MSEQKISILAPYRLVAQFVDGERLIFNGLTEEDAMEAMEAAQEEHGDISWYDGVTDVHYEDGVLCTLIPEPPTINIINPIPDDSEDEPE